MLTVAAAGNGGNAPYIAGTPANAKSALSVAQTQVPSATAFPLVVDAPDCHRRRRTRTPRSSSWSRLHDGFSGRRRVRRRRAARPTPSRTAAPRIHTSRDPTGKVALIDRGACSVSLKVDRAAQAGATAVIIGLVAPGDAYPFANGGGDTVRARPSPSSRS